LCIHRPGGRGRPDDFQPSVGDVPRLRYDLTEFDGRAFDQIAGAGTGNLTGADLRGAIRALLTAVAEA